jgi:hypothetical protein
MLRRCHEMLETARGRGRFGLEPPEVQPWDIADATGRSRWIKPE